MSSKPNEKPKRGRGRPTVLTPEVQEAVCDVLRAGAYLLVAVQHAGIDEKTHGNWMKRGRRQRRGPHHEYFLAVTRAMSDAEVGFASIITEAARGLRAKDGQPLRDSKGRLVAPPDWKAAAWHLQHGPSHERYKRRDEVALGTPDGKGGVAPITFYIPKEDEP